MEKIKITYIGGGSRNWAHALMNDLALETELSGTVALYDIDKEAAEINEKIGNHLSERPDVKGKWVYQAVHTLQEALQGADFVIISILPGTFDHMRADVHAPEKLHIYQSVGDTVGIGGFFRSLRTVPMIAEIAAAIEQAAPNAWVINYTNPMSVCVRTLYKVFPKIKAIGCCHEVFGTQHLLCAAIKDIHGIENIKRSDIHVNVLGINHFTWFDKASYRDMDLFPVYSAFADRYRESGFINEHNANWETDTFLFCERVKFDLFKRFGLIAAAGDRHLAEFVPQLGYLDSPEAVKQWKFGLTTVDWRIADMEKKIQRSERLARFEEEFTLRDTGEEGVAIIRALCGYGRLVTNMNLPNSGQIANLARDSVVETNAVISYDDIRPVAAGAMPDRLTRLIAPLQEIQEKSVEIGLLRDKKQQAREVFETIMESYPAAEAATEEETDALFEELFQNSLIHG